MVDAKAEVSAIEKAFEEFTNDRKDIGILLINQHVGYMKKYMLQRRASADRENPTQIAEKIRYKIDTYTAAFPAVLEIPSKDHPYDPEKDSVLRRVRRLFGE